MEKLGGLILIAVAIFAVFYVALHLNKFKNFVIPVPDAVVNYFKPQLFK